MQHRDVLHVALKGQTDAALALSAREDALLRAAFGCYGGSVLARRAAAPIVQHHQQISAGRWILCDCRPDAPRPPVLVPVAQHHIRRHEDALWPAHAEACDSSARSSSADRRQHGAARPPADLARQPETATRLRSRIELVLDYAAARGWRDRNVLNPAIWRGNLKLMLPSPAKCARSCTMPPCPARGASVHGGAARARGPGREGTRIPHPDGGALGRGAPRTWSKIDLDRAVWTVPAARMKSGRPHRVPLSAQALAILRQQAELRDDTALVFHGQRYGRPQSDMALAAVLRGHGPR